MRRPRTRRVWAVAGALRRDGPRLAALLAGLWCACGTVCARTLGEVRQRGVLSVCAHPDSMPFSRRSGEGEGIELRLAADIARSLGVGLRAEWVALRRDARHARCDALMSVPVLAEGGRGGPQLSVPFARQVTRLVVRGGRETTSLEELRAAPVAVAHGSLAHRMLFERGVPVRTVHATDEDRISAVERGEAGGAAVSDWAFGWYRACHPGTELRQVRRNLLGHDIDFDVAVMLRGADPDLRRRVDEAIGELRRSGQLAATFRTYGIEVLEPGPDPYGSRVRPAAGTRDGERHWSSKDDMHPSCSIR